ncbi:MAG TPA: TetR/AcrR family transcriptional regulator [Acidimicrobiia bacterium]|nr:TetR/AcrR family transcriptional regulator [Acidimicrobiia bacterium]
MKSALRRREPVQREEILQSALRIAKTEGLSAITMRRLASDLGVSPMACYWHVANKEELLVLLADHVLSQVPSPEGNRARWAEELDILAHQICDALSQAPGLATWVLNQNPLLITPSSLRLADAATSLLLNAGFDGRSAAAAFAALYIYVTGQVHLRERPKAPPDASASMLSGEYPTLVQIAEFLGDFGNGGLFDYGLARLLEGFQHDLTRIRQARPAAGNATRTATGRRGGRSPRT